MISLILATCLLIAQIEESYSIGVYSKDDRPFGKSYDTWAGKYWNWDAGIPLDPETNTFAGLKENGCLMHQEDSMVMLLDTAAGGTWQQICKIPSGSGILIPFWTGVCSQADQGYASASFDELAVCAEQADMGWVSDVLKVNNTVISRLEAVDLVSTISSNVQEIKASKFNITIPLDSHLALAKYGGTFPAVAHGWFVFLEPLPPGDYVIFYDNHVGDKSREAGANVNTAQITYRVRVA